MWLSGRADTADRVLGVLRDGHLKGLLADDIANLQIAGHAELDRFTHRNSCWQAVDCRRREGDVTIGVVSRLEYKTANRTVAAVAVGGDPTGAARPDRRRG